MRHGCAVNSVTVPPVAAALAVPNFGCKRLRQVHQLTVPAATRSRISFTTNTTTGRVSGHGAVVYRERRQVVPYPTVGEPTTTTFSPEICWTHTPKTRPACTATQNRNIMGHIEAAGSRQTHPQSCLTMTVSQFTAAANDRRCVLRGGGGGHLLPAVCHCWCVWRVVLAVNMMAD